MASVIEVRDLVKRYRRAGRNAVDGVSFDVEEGEFLALLALNGAGKTATVGSGSGALSGAMGCNDALRGW